MHNSLHKVIALSLATLVFTSTMELFGLTNTWSGVGGNDLRTHNSWNPNLAPPTDFVGPTDIAQFDMVGVAHPNPSLAVGETVTLNEFLFLPTTIGVLGFTDTATPFQYTFTINGLLSFSATTLAVGINNQTGVQQIFNVNGSAGGLAEIDFFGNSSSDAMNSGNNVMNLISGGTVAFFSTAHTNNTFFDLQGVGGNRIDFNDNSSSDLATFVFNSSTNIVFYTSTSSAGTAEFDFNASGNTISFGGLSTADLARFNFGANTGTVNFLQTGGTFEFDGVINGAANVLVQPNAAAAATQIWTGENTYTGGTTINGTTGAVTLKLVGSGSLANGFPLGTGSVTMSGAATLDITQKYNSLTIGALNSSGANNFILLGNNNLTSFSAVSNTFNGVISGLGGFILDGGGVLTLSGINTYTGGTTVKHGSTLNITAAPTGIGEFILRNTGSTVNQNVGALGISDLNGDAGTVFNINGNVLTATTVKNDDFDGIISSAPLGGGVFIKAGITILTLGGPNFYSAATNVNAGTLQAGGTNTFSPNSQFTVASGATLDLNNFNNQVGALSGAGFVTLGSGTLSLELPLISTTFTGTISGTGGLTKDTTTGASTFTLNPAVSGTNVYTGPTTVNAGTLMANKANSFSAFSDVILNDTATLNLNNFSNVIGSLASASMGTSVTLGGSALTILTLGGTDLSTSYAGHISGAGGVTKTGEGVFTLATGGAATYSGPTTVNFGTFRAGANQAFPTGSDFSLFFASTLDLNNTNETLQSLSGTQATLVSLGTGVLTLTETSSTEFDGSIIGTMTAGAGALVINNNTFTLGGSGKNTYLGTTVLNGNGTTLQANAENAFPEFSAVTLNNSSQLNLNNFDNIVGSVASTFTGAAVHLGAGTLTMRNGSTTTYAGSIDGSGGLKLEGNHLILTQAGGSTYSGPTIVENGGSISASALNTLSPSSDYILDDTSIITLNQDNMIGSLASESDSTFVHLNSFKLTTGENAISTIFAGIIDGTGSLVKDGCGTFTLCNANTYSGSTTINGGTLALIGSLSPSTSVTLTNTDGNNSTFDISGILSSQTITDLNGTTNTTVNLGNKQLIANTTMADTFNGVMEGQGGNFTKGGINTLTFTNFNTYTGGTNITGGTLALSGNGTLAPTGFVTVNSGTTFDISQKTSPSQTIGDLNGGGTVSLGSNNLRVVTVNPTGDTFSGVIADGGIGGGTGGSFTKAGETLLTLTGANTYTGLTFIEDGTLALSGAGNLSPVSPLEMNSDTTFDISAKNSPLTMAQLSGGDDTSFVLLGNNTFHTNASAPIATTFGAEILDSKGLGAFYKDGSYSLTLTGDSNYGSSGSPTSGTFITGGSLFFRDNGKVSPTSNVTMNNTTATPTLLDISGITADEFTIADLNGTGTNTVNLGSKELILGTPRNSLYQGSILGSGPTPQEGGMLTKVGTGSLTLSGITGGVFTYTGGTNIVDGKLILTSGANLASTGNVTLFTGTVPGGTTFDISATTPQTIGDLNGGINTFVNLGGNTLTTGTARDAVFNGVISGAGGKLIKNGTGRLTLTGLSGPNTYSGGTTVTTGTLAGNTISLQGNIVDNAKLVFDQNFNGIFNGTLAGNGDMFKFGTGQLAIIFNSPAFTGTSHIFNGNFSLNALLGGNVIIEDDAIITGTGTVGGNLTVTEGGQIQPGNGTIGTLNILGNYLQNPGTVYQVQLNAATSSLINANGMATIVDGTVFVTSVDGTFSLNHPYVIVNANGGRIGVYDDEVGTRNIIGNNLLFTPVLSYTPTQVLLNFQTTIHNIVCGPNENKVSLILDQIVFPSPQVEAILQTIIQFSSTGQVCSVLTSLLGVQNFSNMIQTEFANRQFIRRLYDPLRPIVTTEPCVFDRCYPNDCYGDSCLGDGLMLWGDISGTRYNLDKTSNIRGFHANGFEITFGAQQTFWYDWTVGGALSYENDHLHYSQSGNGHDYTYFGGVYGLYRPRCWYALADLAVSYSHFKTHRNINIGPLHFHTTSHPKDWQLTGYGEVGTDLDIWGIMAQPFAGLEVDSVWFRKFHESGAGDINLIVHSHEYTNVSSRLGFHLTGNSCGFLFSVDAAWDYRWNSSESSLTEQFQGFGPAFSISGIRLPRNSFDGAVSFYKDLGENWTIYGEVSGEVWSRASIFNGLIGVEARW